MNEPIRIALIGFGFMGKLHAAVYHRLPNVELVAVVDPQIELVNDAVRESGLSCPVFSSYAEAAGLHFSVVDVCLPTDLHTTIVLEALGDGKHVFCEKPISLTRDNAQEMVDAARLADRQLMIGQCIRFWPEYVELKRVVDSGEYGRILSLSMSRRSGRPGYSVGDWVNRPERCMGAALDLHIHDSDFLLHLLGRPRAVFSQAVSDATGWSSIVTQYVHDGTTVVADGAWNYPEKWGFQMRFSAVFENAVLDYDSRAADPLTRTLADGATLPVKLSEAMEGKDGYFHELSYFVNCIERGEPVAISTGEQAAASLDLVLTEIESAETGRLIHLHQ